MAGVNFVAGSIGNGWRNLLIRARDRYRDQAGIAEALGVNQSTIARKLKRYNLT